MKRTFAAAALVGLLGTGVVLPATAFAVDSSSSPTAATQSGQRPARPTDAERKAKGQEILKALVTKGTITQAQADKIVAALEAARPARPADGQAPAAGQTKTTGQAPAAGQTTTTGQAASGSNARTRPNPADAMKKVLATLVSNNTLTQAQSDAVVAAFEAARPARPAGAPQGQNRPQNAPTTSGATATRS